jgi:type II secretory pathway component PulF
MDIERCLRTLERESKEPLQSVLKHIMERVRQGESLSEAMAKAEVFSPFHIRIIRAGEFSGNLHLALTRIASVIEREAEIRSRIRNAVAYPLFLVGFGILSFCSILLFILPKFTTVYREMGSKLPFTTSVLLDISSFLRTSAFWLLPLIAVGAFILFHYAFQFRNNPATDRFRMGLPVIGQAVREIHTAALLRNLGLLLQSGLPITQSLDICAKISDSAIFAKAVTEIEKGVEQGARISVEMRRQNLFSETVLNLVSVGEESGRLDALLLQTSEEMEKKMDQIVKGAVALLEPFLILTVGILIGLMVIATLLPIFSLSATGFKR